MDWFYDGQIRRYVTQFMRIFIGFKYKTGDDTLRHIPVSYGDLTRQVASIIMENSENKMMTVPKIACYISGLELDTARLADASFVSKMQIRERAFEDFYPDDHPDVRLRGTPIYENYQGAGYTVERLMPTPFKLSMKAELWSSNTDQKLQILEQILMLFNPSLEIQTTDNYIDWTSISVVDLKNINFSSRTIPQGADTNIDIATMEFTIPIYITPPAKVKKMGVIRNLVMNVFTDSGDVKDLEELIYNQESGDAQIRTTPGQFGVLLLKSSNGQDRDYDLSVISPGEAVSSMGLLPPIKQGERVDWEKILNVYGGYNPGISKIYFLQPSGNEIGGTFVVNEVDPTYLLITMDIDSRPSNTIISGSARSSNQWTTVDAIIDPYKYNPKRPNGEMIDQSVAAGIRFLMLDDVNNSASTGLINQQNWDSSHPSDSSQGQVYDGPDGWKNSDGNDPVIKANSIIEWSGTSWTTVWNPDDHLLEDAGVSGEDFVATYFQNLRTGVQYRWDGEQWLKSFEGEYSAGYWRLDLDPQ
jgi:hypothetical protein